MFAKPRQRSHALVALLLAFVVVALGTAPAYAHTKLDVSVPTQDQIVDGELSTIVLTFSKPVEPLGDTIVVTDEGGSLAGGDVTVRRSSDGLVVTGDLSEPLGDGSWQVDWRVLATDSHPREGAFTFVVARGEPEPEATVAPSAPAPEASTPSAIVAPRPTESFAAAVSAPTARPTSAQRGLLESLGSVSRIVFYLGLMTAAGLALFTAGPHRGETERARRMSKVAGSAAVIALIASVGDIAFHVAAVSGDGITGIVDVDTWGPVLRTGLGTAFAVRTVGLALIAFAALHRVRRDKPSGVDAGKLVGTALALGSFQFVGHTASAAPEIVVRSADIVHAVAAAIWIGGLVGLLLLSRRADPDVRARTAARFSTVATVAVVAVALAGSALAWVNLPTLAATWETGYGQLLLAKLALVGVLAALGAHNHFKVVPMLEHRDAGAHAALRRTVTTEVAVVIVVVALTALLVNASPS